MGNACHLCSYISLEPEEVVCRSCAESRSPAILFIIERKYGYSYYRARVLSF
jgi:hypothetical protein